MLIRTTLFAEEETLHDLRRLAEEQDTSTAELVRQAVKEFIDRHQVAKPGFSFLGIGRSHRHDISARVDELLWKDTRTAKLTRKRKGS